MPSRWIVQANDVGHLVARIFDPQRFEPLVIVSPASDTGAPRVDIRALETELPAGTELAVLGTMNASERLSNSVDSAFQCYGGGVRVVVPNASRSDSWRRHKLITIFPNENPATALRSIITQVEAASMKTEYLTNAPPPTGMLGDEQTRALQRFKETLTVESAHLTRPSGTRPRLPAPAAQPTAAPLPPERSSPAVTPQKPDMDGLNLDGLTMLLDAQAAAITERVSHSITDIILELFGDQREETGRQRSRADAAEQDLDALQRRHEHLIEDRHHLPTVYTDPEQQFRWEVEHEWLVGTPEPERTSLRRYSIAPAFLGNLEAHIVPRHKTIQVVVDVLASRVWERRACHQFKDAARGGTQRVRGDGATAWRAYIKSESHGAPRLIWWELPNGTVELDHAGHHDDQL